MKDNNLFIKKDLYIAYKKVKYELFNDKSIGFDKKKGKFIFGNI